MISFSEFIKRLATSVQHIDSIAVGEWLDINMAEYIRESYRDFMAGRPLSVVDAECAAQVAQRVEEIDAKFAASETFDAITLAYAGNEFSRHMLEVFGASYSFDLPETMKKAGLPV